MRLRLQMAPQTDGQLRSVDDKKYQSERSPRDASPDDFIDGRTVEKVRRQKCWSEESRHGSTDKRALENTGRQKKNVGVREDSEEIASLDLSTVGRAVEKAERHTRKMERDISGEIMPSDGSTESQ